MSEISENGLEHRARRAARRAGLVAQKSRWRRDTVDNLGRFRLVDPFHNLVVEGVRFDMTPQDVIEYCAERGAG